MSTIEAPGVGRSTLPSLRSDNVRALAGIAIGTESTWDVWRASSLGALKSGVKISTEGPEGGSPTICQESSPPQSSDMHPSRCNHRILTPRRQALTEVSSKPERCEAGSGRMNWSRLHPSSSESDLCEADSGQYLGGLPKRYHLSTRPALCSELEICDTVATRCPNLLAEAGPRLPPRLDS